MSLPWTFSQGSTEIRERLSQQDIQHVKELRCLDNAQLVPILRDELCRSFRWIVSIKFSTVDSPRNNFLQIYHGGNPFLLLQFWHFENTNWYILHCDGFCSKVFSNKYGCHDVMERRCKQYFLFGVQKSWSFSELCKSKQMESSFSGAIYKIDQGNHSPKARLCFFVLPPFETSLFEPATEINICMHSKAAEPVVGKT